MKSSCAARSCLDTLLRANDTLHRVYLLKEELRLLWEQPTQLHAHWLLQQWLRTTRELGLRPLNRLYDTIEQPQDRILLYNDPHSARGIFWSSSGFLLRCGVHAGGVGAVLLHQNLDF